jgi:hypothetical protein
MDEHYYKWLSLVRIKLCYGKTNLVATSQFDVRLSIDQRTISTGTGVVYGVRCGFGSLTLWEIRVYYNKIIGVPVLLREFYSEGIVIQHSLV